jgi:hypothetical protein
MMGTQQTSIAMTQGGKPLVNPAMFAGRMRRRLTTLP